MSRASVGEEETMNERTVIKNGTILTVTHGKIENGVLSVSVPGGQTSKRQFADCTVHGPGFQ